MKKLFIFIIVIVIFFTLAGCMGYDANGEKGNNYKVTLYSDNGQVVKEFNASSYVKGNGSDLILQVNSKSVHINGTYVVEELK